MPLKQEQINCKRKRVLLLRTVLLLCLGMECYFLIEPVAGGRELQEEEGGKGNWKQACKCMQSKQKRTKLQDNGAAKD